MSQLLQPIALPPCFPLSLLEYVLEHYSQPTTLLICSTRAAFFTSLLQAVASTNHDEPLVMATDTTAIAVTTDMDVEAAIPVQNPLLIPTFQQISISRNVHTVFLPTVSHLRAYLAVYEPANLETPQKYLADPENPKTRAPLMVVYGLVALHRDTSEWAAQGLSSTIASLVDAGFRAKQKVVIMEEKTEGFVENIEAGYEGVVEASGEDLQGVRSREEYDKHEQERLGWLKEKLPMLNGTTRRVGMEAGDGWSGRTVDVGRVLSRWCRLIESP